LQVSPNNSLEITLAALEIVKWVEFPRSLLLFARVPGNSQSGAIYFLDRKSGVWYAIDFDDQEYGGYNVKQFEALLEECRFLNLVERPGLLWSGLPWRVQMGKEPEVGV